MLDGAFIWASCVLRSGLFWVSWWHSLWFSEAEIWSFFSSVGFLLCLLGFEISYLGCVKLWSWSCGSCEAWGFGGSLKCWGWFIEDCGMKSLIKGWTFCGVWVRLSGCEWGWNWLCFVVKPVSVEDSEVGVWGFLWFALHEFEVYWMEFCPVKI